MVDLFNEQNRAGDICERNNRCVEINFEECDLQINQTNFDSDFSSKGGAQFNCKNQNLN